MDREAICLDPIFLEIAKLHKKIALSDPKVFGMLSFKPEQKYSYDICVLSYSIMSDIAIVFCPKVENGLEYYLYEAYGKCKGFYKVFLSELPMELFSNPVPVREPLKLSEITKLDQGVIQVA